MTTVDVPVPARLRAHLASPDGAGPWPGVVVIHDAFGYTADVRNHADSFARNGYLAVSPDLYSRGNRVQCMVSTFRDLAYLTEQVLKFTSLSWKSTLPAKKPVTIYYSELIAGLLARFRAVPDWSPAVLNTKLRASRWFL